MAQPALPPAEPARPVMSAETLVFWALVLLHLVPVWSFTYLPTQDGPSHLANALILRDLGDPAAGYDQFFELRDDPLPNLTAPLLLAGLLYLLPPLIAEKVLVSLYILGFAAAYRYFLGAFGARCRPLAWAGLLFVYNHCLWMGFYNYCLSLALFFAILGYCLQRRGQFQLPQAAGLMFLFTAAYFTHLVAYLLGVAGALAATVLARPRRQLAPVLVGLAALPAACLTLDYFERTGFFQSSASQRLLDQPLNRIRGMPLPMLGHELAQIDTELFEYQAGSDPPFSLFVVPYFILLGVFTLMEYRGSRGEEAGGPGHLFPALFGLLTLALCVLLPQHLSFDQGGFLKSRVAMLPPLFWLACLREPVCPVKRLIVRTATLLLLGLNLVLVLQAMAAGNGMVAPYTAGIDAVGRGHRLFIAQRDMGGLVDPLLHAGNYYCLGTGNINLNNYEASTPHFPVKYRQGVHRGWSNWSGYPGKDAIDVVLCWRTAAPGPAGWDEIFNQGLLRIYRRPQGR